MPNDGQTLLLDTENKLYHGVDINDAIGKPKSKASPTSNMLPFYIAPPTTSICPTRWIGKKQDVTSQMKTKGMLRKQSVLTMDNVCPAKYSEGKRAYVDRVNHLKKAAIDASDRVETYLLAVKAANKSPSWELPEATELFKLMHNKYAQAQLLGDFSLGIMQREYQDYLWNSRNQKSGSKSDDSNNSTPSGNTTGGASKRVEEYLDGVKVATKADMSLPWELPEAIQVYKIIRMKEVVEHM